VLLSKYYPYLGRKYSVWSGQGSITGVTTDKNLLGVTTYILSLGALWQILQLWPDRRDPDRKRQFLAQCVVLGFGIWLLCNADSATSTACFALGAFVMLVTSSPRMVGRPAAVHKLVLTLVIIVGLIQVTGAYAAVIHAMGRNTDLTGRADIWPVLIPMAPSQLVGAGFESFWLGPRLLKVWNAFPNLYVSEAHNGYIEVYLNLGLCGLALVFVLLINGYRRSVAGFRVDSNLARLMLALVLSAAMYSYTEAGFRMLDYAWSFLLIALIGAGNIVSLASEHQEVAEPLDTVEWPTDGMPTTSSCVSR
jgi:O-antigen ligase